MWFWWLQSKIYKNEERNAMSYHWLDDYDMAQSLLEEFRKTQQDRPETIWRDLIGRHVENKKIWLHVRNMFTIFNR